MTNYYIMSMEDFQILKNKIVLWFKSRNSGNVVDTGNEHFIVPPQLVNIPNEGFQLNQKEYPCYLLTRHQQIEITSILMEENRISRRLSRFASG